CTTTGDACATLVDAGSARVFTGATYGEGQAVIFMFPGVGDQYKHMTQELYEHEPNFRVEMDLCFELLKSRTGINFRDLLYPAKTISDPNSRDRTAHDRPLRRL